MERLHAGRPVVGVLVAVALLAGCGGTGLGGSVPTEITQNVAHHATSASGALIYAPGGCGGTCVLSYPDGQIVASIAQYGSGPCSDAAGDVFIPNGSQIFEYQHGGTTPIKTLSLPDTYDTGYNCSVDVTTNNLAVFYQAKDGGVAVFTDGSGVPTHYYTAIDGVFGGYDNAGNLFADGFSTSPPDIALSELPRGQSQFTVLTIKGKLRAGPGALQWDGTDLALEGVHAIVKLSIAGSVATVVRTIPLKGNQRNASLSWIYDGTVLVPYSIRSGRFNKIGIWSYPKGGKRKAALKFSNSKFWKFEGITVSVAPTR